MAKTESLTYKVTKGHSGWVTIQGTSDSDLGYVFEVPAQMVETIELDGAFYIVDSGDLRFFANYPREVPEVYRVYSRGDGYVKKTTKLRHVDLSKNSELKIKIRQYAMGRK